MVAVGVVCLSWPLTASNVSVRCARSFLLHTELDDVAMGKAVGIDSADLQANSRRLLVM